jgi:MFS family permease
MGFIISTY